MIRRRIIREKPFLRRLYQDWYRSIAAELPQVPGRVLEVGSGAGFLNEFVEDLITSETFPYPDVSLVLDARKLPFDEGSLRAILMTDVLHHIPDVECFLRDAQRTLVGGGRLIMIEPWNTPWSRFVYGRFHTEPFLPLATEWRFPSGGPLSGANGALPWMIFARDRARFVSTFPALMLRRIEPMMPFRYLASGGVSMRSLSPSSAYPLWASIEKVLAPLNGMLAMFALIVLERRQ